MTLHNPEPYLLRVLELDIEQINPSARKEALHFIEFGECGLAYDVLVFDIQDGKYEPTPRAVDLIKQSATAIGFDSTPELTLIAVEFPSKPEPPGSRAPIRSLYLKKPSSSYVPEGHHGVRCRSRAPGRMCRVLA